jgi:hypothetical protein
MRLINVNTMQVEQFVEDRVPKYAILSHRWEDEEVSYRDMSLSDVSKKKGYSKIEKTCRLARNTVADTCFEYVWVDTCCIDRTNSTELAEAINSMFRWYKESVICYAWLSDLDPAVSIEVGLPGCTWFTRGWTLQELLAPKRVFFYDKSWTKRGSKETLRSLLSRITGIEEEVLNKKEDPSMVSAAVKMSWASRRRTTKMEDIAYCLLGIFDVNMPLLYGEGPTKAFRRLQEEIIKETNDTTLFTWTPLHEQQATRGIFARSPEEYHLCRGIFQTSFADNDIFTFTNQGLQINTRLIEHSHQDRGGSSEKPLPSRLVLDLNCYDLGRGSVGILLRKYGRNLFLRDLTGGGLCFYDRHDTSIKRLPAQTINIPRDISDLMRRNLEMRLLFTLHLKVENGLEIMEAVPVELWDPSFGMFHTDVRNTMGRCIAAVLRPSHKKDSTEDIVIIIAGMAFMTGACNFYQIPRQDPKANDILENLATLTDLDLQNPPLGLPPIQHTQLGPPICLFGRQQLPSDNFSNRGEAKVTLPSGVIRLRHEIKEITGLKLPLNQAVDCVTISYTSNVKFGGDDEVDGKRAGTEEHGSDDFDDLIL